jgi:hypothetical protein
MARFGVTPNGRESIALGLMALSSHDPLGRRADSTHIQSFTKSPIAVRTAIPATGPKKPGSTRLYCLVPHDG